MNRFKHILLGAALSILASTITFAASVSEQTPLDKMLANQDYAEITKVMYEFLSRPSPKLATELQDKAAFTGDPVLLYFSLKYLTDKITLRYADQNDMDTFARFIVLSHIRLLQDVDCLLSPEESDKDLSSAALATLKIFADSYKKEFAPLCVGPDIPDLQTTCKSVHKWFTRKENSNKDLYFSNPVWTKHCGWYSMTSYNLAFGSSNSIEKAYLSKCSKELQALRKQTCNRELDRLSTMKNWDEFFTNFIPVKEHESTVEMTSTDKFSKSNPLPVTSKSLIEIPSLIPSILHINEETKN